VFIVYILIISLLSRHPSRPVPNDVENQVNFSGKIHVFHSAITRFYSPSDFCGPCGMCRQRIRCRHDTAFVVQDFVVQDEEKRIGGAHLLPKYGVGMLPYYITHVNALNTFHTYLRESVRRPPLPRISVRLILSLSRS